MKRVCILVMICLLFAPQFFLSDDQQLFGRNNDNLLKYENSWAILIGINDFKHWDDLDYALNDVQDVRQVLIEDYGFKEDNIRIYQNKDVTLESVQILLWGDFINKIGVKVF